MPDWHVDPSYTFVMTCCACPEQYDLYCDGVQIAYVRLRHGKLTAETPDCGDELFYYHEWPGTDLGGFDGNEDRAVHLLAIVEAWEATR